MSQSSDAELGAWKAVIDMKEQAIAERFPRPPEGKFYEADVPDTLDLADRAALAVNCLTGALDPDYGYELYLWVHFAWNPPYMKHEASGLPTVNPKFAESLPMMRLMSGSKQNLDIQRGMMARTLALIADDGLYYAPILGRPWHQTNWCSADEDFANVCGNGRLVLALLAWYQYDGDPLWMEYAKKVVAGLSRIARVKGDRAYFPDPKIGENFSYPKSGYRKDLPEPTDTGFGLHAYHSGVIRALAKYAAMTGDRDALELARKLVNFVCQPKMWGAGVEPNGVTGAEKAHFAGHFHSHTASLRGLLEYAIVANDADLKEFVRNGYEFARSFGISRIGWFPEATSPRLHCEACCTADMVALAVKLTDAAAGDYWDDVDCYVRNQLAEQQLTSKDLLEKLAAASPPHKAVPPTQTDDRVIERNIGGWAGFGAIATLPNTWIMHCCTGNGSQALYYTWEGIVRETSKGGAQINLLLNRTSQWLDVDSYLPYEGKVVIKNKTAKMISVRMPAWFSRRDVRCAVASKPVSASWVGSYLVFEGPKPGSEIEIDFPVAETTTKATLDEVTYTLRFRGNTLVGFSYSDPSTRGMPIRDGRLILADGGRAVAKGVQSANVKVSADANSNAEAGIILRYQNPGTFLLAKYANKSISFHEVVNGGPGQPLDVVPAEGFAPRIIIAAEVRGSEATMTVTDGQKTVAARHKIAGISGAGAVGLFHNGAPAQLFDNFRASDSRGTVLFEDGFDDPNVSSSRWESRVEIPTYRRGTKNDYPIYRRGHIRSGKAPMVRKKRYVLDRHIEG